MFFLFVCFFSLFFSVVVSSLLFPVKSHCAMCLLQADHTVWTEERMWNAYCLKSSVLKDRGSVFRVNFYPPPPDIYLCLEFWKSNDSKCKSSLCLDIWCHVDLMSREPWSNTKTLQFTLRRCDFPRRTFLLAFFPWNVTRWTWLLCCKHTRTVKLMVTGRGLKMTRVS